MNRWLGNKRVYVTLTVLFTLGIALNSFAGGSLPSFGTGPWVEADRTFGGGHGANYPNNGAAKASIRANTPVLSSDSREITITVKDSQIRSTSPHVTRGVIRKDGPIFPPDPRATVAVIRKDGPIFPPDPRVMAVVRKDGPIFPPDPRVVAVVRKDGPIFPPDPRIMAVVRKDGPIFPPDPRVMAVIRKDGPIFPPDPRVAA
jgi:hypothetical protein